MSERKCLLDRGLSCARRYQQQPGFKLQRNSGWSLLERVSNYNTQWDSTFWWTRFSMWSLHVWLQVRACPGVLAVFELHAHNNITQWVTKDGVCCWPSVKSFHQELFDSRKQNIIKNPWFNCSYCFISLTGSQVASNSPADASGQQDEDRVHQDADP